MMVVGTVKEQDKARIMRNVCLVGPRASRGLVFLEFAELQGVDLKIWILVMLVWAEVEEEEVWTCEASLNLE